MFMKFMLILNVIQSSELYYITFMKNQIQFNSKFKLTSNIKYQINQLSINQKLKLSLHSQLCLGTNFITKYIY